MSTDGSFNFEMAKAFNLVTGSWRACRNPASRWTRKADSSWFDETEFEKSVKIARLKLGPRHSKARLEANPSDGQISVRSESYKT
jgi:hypothetical protein